MPQVSEPPGVARMSALTIRYRLSLLRRRVIRNARTRAEVSLGPVAHLAVEVNDRPGWLVLVGDDDESLVFWLAGFVGFHKHALSVHGERRGLLRQKAMLPVGDDDLVSVRTFQDRRV
jgi:hypothetical protein